MKILYIGGAGRSGSTLLEMILGNVPGFFSVGEVRYFWEYLHQGDVRCGCGTPLAECVFWSAVAKQLHNVYAVNVGQLAVLAGRVDRTRNIPALSTGLNAWGGDLAAITRRTGELYQAIWESSEQQIIVDSSKVPSHLALLRRIAGVDLRVLHLVRDGRAVAYSWSRRRKRELAVTGERTQMPHRSAALAMLAWSVENSSIARLGRQLAYYTVLRYEDFVQAPGPALGQALAALGFQGIDLAHLEADQVLVLPTHSVGGNPLRFSQVPLRIEPDEEWRHQMHPVTKAALGLLGAPVLPRFNYTFW
ncbi:MAG: sulfotransferase [Chloroflexi bacterium]|nr:sulfotransferase [Chloroflexota bacterium]MCI0650187.1 sulfotransferase [Chloroflexota bacterium]MCI0729502.1 sulfotransferase [Chloroflexota bacterium]